MPPKFRKGFAPTANDAVAALKGVICTRCPIGKECGFTYKLSEFCPVNVTSYADVRNQVQVIP